MESNSATRTTEQQFKSSSILRRFITQVNSGHFLGGGGYSGLMFVGYLPLASQSSCPIIVYFWANYRPQISHFLLMHLPYRCGFKNRM